VPLVPERSDIGLSARAGKWKLKSAASDFPIAALSLSGLLCHEPGSIYGAEHVM
jgi:hypothetical protein